MSPIKRFLLMLALTSMWSPSFLFIKIAVEELPPMTIVSLRVTIAAFILCLILLFLRRSLPMNIKFWKYTFIMALFASVFPFLLFCYAETEIDSALAAILNGTTPIFTALLAQACVSSDKITIQKAFGIFFSTVGVICLFTPQLLLGFSATAIGMFGALLAAFCYAVSHVYGKLYTTGHPSMVAPAAQMIASTIILWPIALISEENFPLTIPSYPVILSIGGLSIFGTVVAYIVYYKLLECSGPTALSTVACFLPVGGLCLGCLFLNEVFALWELCSSLMVILGLILVNNLIPLESWLVKRKELQTSKTTDLQ